MNVYNMTQESIPAVAELMCTMKPEWWDYEGAFSPVSYTHLLQEYRGRRPLP